jgi:hypothetical protein
MLLPCRRQQRHPSNEHENRREWKCCKQQERHLKARIDKAKKRAADHARKNGLFSAKVGAKMTSLFAMHTM